MAMSMLDYVRMAQPTLRDNLGRADELVAPLVEAYLRHGAGPVRIVACGSSHNAALCARPHLQHSLGEQVVVVTPESYVAFDHDLPAGAFDVFVTQSGYSTNTLAALDFARGRRRLAVALTAYPAAPVHEHADLVVDWGVGVESVDFVTMGVQTLVLFLMAFGIEAARARGVRRDAASHDSGLASAVDAHAGALEATEAFVAARHQALAERTPVMVVGDGPAFGVAAEACLKFNECLKRPAAYHEAEEFVHGPEMQIDPSYLLFFVDDADGSPRVEQLARRFAAAVPKVFLLTSHPAGGDHELALPQVADPLAWAIPTLVPFQWIAAQLMADLDCEDTDPCLEGYYAQADTKAPGYEDAVRELEREAEAGSGR